MNILVTGANGQLGNEMRIVSAASGDRYFFTDLMGGNVGALDVTDIEAVRKCVRDNQIDAIVNCAAYTNVEAAETNAELAEKLNADAPGYLATVMKEVGGLLVHISTDYVFGGEPYNRPCREDQQGTPTGVYGSSKLHGEQKVLATGCNSVIIRTAWLYSEFGKNFCKTMLGLTASKPNLKVVFDQVGTPTYALDLARAIAAVLEDYKTEAGGREKSAEGKIAGMAGEQGTGTAKYSKSGVYHYSNEGVCSWYDFAKMIQQYSGQTACDVQPCHSEEFPSPVKRPAYSVLDKTRIKETFGLEIPYWTDSLQHCIANIKLLESEKR